MPIDTCIHTCIYCTKPIDPLAGEGDHVIPAALGRFKGEFLFRRICRECNSLIGKCEEQLLRCAPEAVLRRMVKPTVRRNNRGASWVGADGIPPPKFMIDRGDHHELVDGSTDDPSNVHLMDQLVIVDKEKGERHIRLFPNMTAPQLRRKIEALGVTPSDQIFLHADDAVGPKHVGFLKELLPGWSFVEEEALEPGVHRVKVRMLCVFHVDYWRAIAKIGFHYYLLNTRRGFHGDEPDFADLRCFILKGGDLDLFFTKPAAHFILPFGELPDGRIELPNVWTHVLAADESHNAAVAMVSLFMGPKHLAPTHHINLGRFRSPVVVPGARCTHSYLYDAQPNQGVYAGRVVAETLTQLR